MDVIPNSDIYLLSRVPLDIKYDRTILFNTPTEQVRFFIGNTTGNGEFNKITFTKQQYQRTNRGYLRLKIAHDLCINYNYLVFRNNGSYLNGDSAPYTQKYYYCFIVDCNYVNENVTEIRYEIDIMQTYLFNYELLPCLVEREHTIDDAFFKYTLPEPIEFGDTIDRMTQNIGHMHDDDLAVMVASTFTEEFNRWHGAVYNGIFSGCAIQFFDVDKPVTDKDSIYNFLEYATNPATGDKSSGIISMYAIPKYYAEIVKNRMDYIDAANTDERFMFDIFTLVKTWIFNDGGVGHANNKLGCYPYSQIVLRQNNGNEIILKPELFRNADGEWENQNMPGWATFYSSFNGNIPPQAEIYPYLYDGTYYNRQYRLVYNDFPPVSWNIDSFRAWIANNVGSLILDTAKDVGSAAVGLFTTAVTSTTGLLTGGLRASANPQNASIIAAQQAGNSMLSGANVASTIGNTLYSLANRVDSIRIANNMPNSYHGQDSQVLDSATRYAGWQIILRTVKPEIATIIDDFFTKYGYMCGKIKIPEREARDYFTFTKTKGCAIKPIGMNADVMQRICDIYDNGITFWRYKAPIGSKSSLDLMQVGNYGVNNTPLDGTVILFDTVDTLLDETGDIFTANNSCTTLEANV